ncbi:MAG TPA: 30S ribosomal protein S18 [Armatimonadota bacterium]|jgi:small subunit ribosomal protein S18
MTSAENAPRPARDRDRGERGGPRGFRRTRPKVCQFCVDKVKALDYKEVGRLRQMVTEHGKMKSRRITGTCATHQRMVAVAVKRARNMALLPFMAG